MAHFAKPEQIAQLAHHPEANWVQGESDLSYLTVPQNIVNPEARKHLCPITNTDKFRTVIVTEVGEDGIAYNSPYDG
jgi:hypothetical protein